DGTSYDPADVQKIHQAFGRDYQLPNATAHNETCANIGNVLWNWRMANLTGDGKYIDVLELALYNSVLSGISLDGDKFLYTNPLRFSGALPFKQRWSKKRVPYISLSNCCPPNVVRTVAEVAAYAYSFSNEALWVNLFSGNVLDTKHQGNHVKVSQESNYPWQGAVKLTISEWPKDLALKIRIPGWAKKASIKRNGQPIDYTLEKGYAQLNGAIKQGDVIHIELPLEVEFMEANPLVEETRNQIAVMRGPIVYCLEQQDIQKGQDLFDLKVRIGDQFKPVEYKVLGQPITFLEGNGYHDATSDSWSSLYRKVDRENSDAVAIR